MYITRTWWKCDSTWLYHVLCRVYWNILNHSRPIGIIKRLTCIVRSVCVTGIYFLLLSTDVLLLLNSNKNLYYICIRVHNLLCGKNENVPINYPIAHNGYCFITTESNLSLYTFVRNSTKHFCNILEKHMLFLCCYCTPPITMHF